jgi:TfoX/Sxy family transcriptional regulator of competence genes
MSSSLAHLRSLLEDATESLPEVTRRRMFGCDAFFAAGGIFGLIWKTGRIGLKLPESEAFDTLLGMDGADPWRAGDMTMSHWVLVPEVFHDDPESLAEWAMRAHALVNAQAVAPKPKGTRTTRIPTNRGGGGRKTPRAPTRGKAKRGTKGKTTKKPAKRSTAKKPKGAAKPRNRTKR